MAEADYRGWIAERMSSALLDGAPSGATGT